jgi:hypothetical protein
MTELTPSVERRSEPRDVAAVLTLVTEVHRDVKDLSARLTVHMTDETMELAEEIATLMRKAFPEGDPDGHRRHHELVIKQAEARAAFWQKMSFEISRWGLIGFLGWAAIALWKSFLVGAVK